MALLRFPVQWRLNRSMKAASAATGRRSRRSRPAIRFRSANAKPKLVMYSCIVGSPTRNAEFDRRDVARFGQRVRNRQGSKRDGDRESTRLATVIEPIWQSIMIVRLRQTFFQRRRESDDLESGARLVNILQRPVGSLVRRGRAHIVWIERRRICQRQDFAGLWIQHDRGSRLRS